MGKVPAEDKELFFKHISLNDESVKPVVTYNTEDGTKIESVTNPQYVYVKSLKVTTYTDVTLESVTPADGSSAMTPEEVVFTFNKEIKSVAKAEIYDCDSNETIDVTALLIRDGKTVKVPYAFEDEKNYKVTLTSASDGMTWVDATTSFKAEAWKFSNLTENPAVALPENNNRYFINEDFTNSTGDSRETIILPANTSDGWYLEAPGTASIVELEDTNKVVEIATNAETLFQIQQHPKKGNLDNTTTLSFDVYIEEGSNTFAIHREQGSGRVLIASWFKGAWSGMPMTAGQWHNVVITISDTAGTSLYVDGMLLKNTPKDPAAPGINATGYFRFVVNRANVKIDNLKLYLNKNKTVLTAVTPAYDAMDVKVSEPLVFTYNEFIGDVSGAKLILKPNDTNEETVLTDGNGMSVSAEGNSVKITLSEALKENTGYALEFSGIKNTADMAVEAIKTRFSTVYDPAWEVKDFEGSAESASTKKYSVKVKNETNAEGACMAVAVYDGNGNLKDVVFSAPAISGNDWVELSATVNYAAGNSSKIFIWDSLENMNLIRGIISD